MAKGLYVEEMQHVLFGHSTIGFGSSHQISSKELTSQQCCRNVVASSPISKQCCINIAAVLEHLLGIGYDTAGFLSLNYRIFFVGALNYIGI